MSIVNLRLEQQKGAIDLLSTLRLVEINPVDVCNRSCSFCPRSDPTIYTNRKWVIKEETTTKLANDLKDIGFNNRIGFVGMGEPKLHKKLRETINGYGSGNSADPLNPEKINEKINIVLKVYEKIISTDFERVGLIDSSFQRLIDDALNDLEDKKGNKVTEEAKKVIQQTGNPDSGTEQISMFNDIMGTIEDIGGGEVDNSDNEKTDLKEEIKRIKSLFGNDRVYGNLIK